MTGKSAKNNLEATLPRNPLPLRASFFHLGRFYEQEGGNGRSRVRRRKRWKRGGGSGWYHPFPAALRPSISYALRATVQTPFLLPSTAAWKTTFSTSRRSQAGYERHGENLMVQVTNKVTWKSVASIIYFFFFLFENVTIIIIIDYDRN